MLTHRWGTLVVVIGWLGSWGLVFVHGAFSIVPALPLMVAVAVAPIIVEYYRMWGLHDFDFILFPLTQRHARHNARARLRHRIAALAECERVCEELIETSTEEEATKIPVLEAERDAAEREITRLWGDIRRLEAGWEREDRERRYKELTGG